MINLVHSIQRIVLTTIVALVTATSSAAQIPPPVMDLTSFYLDAYASGRNRDIGFVEFDSKTRNVVFYGSARFVPCLKDPTIINSTVLTQRQIVEDNTWVVRGASYCPGTRNYEGEPFPPTSFRLRDTITFGNPVRRKTLRGEEFDASPMSIVRDGVPWITYFWGYRLGLVESRSVVDTLSPGTEQWPKDVLPNSSFDFKLLELPPAIVEGIVTEYQNTRDFPNSPGGIYFYASTDAERALLNAQPSWQRTGKSFEHGGYASVCRFYGSTSPGPNTHFYTVSESECNFLKSRQRKPTPSDVQQLNFEGIAFYANTLIPPRAAGFEPTCPARSIPLYRAYNAAFGPNGKKNYDSNHRFSTSKADIAEVVAKGWVDEGAVMCVASQFVSATN